MLKEDRTVQHIKEKWWITKNVPIIDGVPTNCTVEKEKSDELDIAHVLGVFLILLLGIGLAILIGILEFLWNVRKVSISQKVNSNRTNFQIQLNTEIGLKIECSLISLIAMQFIRRWR